MKVYDESWRNWHEQDLALEDCSRINVKVPVGACVLDAGCGDGYLLERLAQKADLRIGLDLSREALKLARRRLGSEVRLVQGSLEALPFTDNAFNAVVSTHTLEHVRDFEKSVTELKRITAHRLVILIPAQEYLPYTEDYHLHFFHKEEDFLRRVNIEGAVCERYRNPPGRHKYQGELLLLMVDL